MASIFTFDPDPPRVSSPWLTPRTNTPKVPGSSSKDHFGSVGSDTSCDTLITKLEAEPQEGPTEYKLHLLLRPRRSFTSISTGYKISGSHRTVSQSPTPRGNSETRLTRTPSLQARSIQTRQQRLEQLTTQLLWRLQQSCPHHSSSYGHQIAPSFPDASKLGIPLDVGKAIAGLEESSGALYEIGVADDGTFVGLADDEMNESVNNLRAMAASLGCVVDILRKVSVGECEWLDDSADNGPTVLRKEKLWVVEAYVKTNSGAIPPHTSTRSVGEAPLTNLDVFGSLEDTRSTTQLKVSLTGATMSGKTSLLGSLTTATLDNGRGKSRLSLLKHRHEIASGMTSSLTQELIGYSDAAYLTGQADAVHVVNYAAGNISSWVDIHGACDSGRLALISDSAGHPRYRRTTVRGLIGWAPDWTLLCVPADNTEDTSGMTGSTPPPEEVLGVASVDIDLSQAHLELCLKLNLSLVVVVTKYDLATKSGLRNCLSQVLSVLKKAGKKPIIVQSSSSGPEESDLHFISTSAIASCASVVETLRANPFDVVPIVLTSAVNGGGISTLHALLYALPIPHPTISSTAYKTTADSEEEIEQPPKSLFHIEDVYTARHSAESDDALPVLSGHLRYGRLNIGDELVLGPYMTESNNDDSDSSAATTERPHIPTSLSFPGALYKAKGLPLQAGSNEEWRRVTVTSLRNLRLPVRTLFEGQAGTVGVWPVPSTIHTPALARIRKGMILATERPRAKRVVVAEVARSDADSLSIGQVVVVYLASVRASAKVIAGTTPDDADSASIHSFQEEGSGFSFDKDEHFTEHGQQLGARMLVTFQFIASREYVEAGSQVFVMPGGGPGLYGGQERGEKGVGGLEGFVGRIVNSLG
jgi:GTPase